MAANSATDPWRDAAKWAVTLTDQRTQACCCQRHAASPFQTELRRMSDWQSLPFAPPVGSRLCAETDIPDGQGKEIVFGEGKDAFRVVVFRLRERLFAYHNCCAHFSIPLNYEPDRFHVFDGELLMCAHHTAIYRIEDGTCIDGPCQGARLTPIALARDGGVLYVGDCGIGIDRNCSDFSRS